MLLSWEQHRIQSAIVDVSLFWTFKSTVSWHATSATPKEIWDNLSDLSSIALNIGWKRSSLAEWVYTAMREIATKPSLWIHAWRHQMAAPQEEHKVNVDCAKLVFAVNTLFAPTRHGTVPETTVGLTWIRCEEGSVCWP